MTQSRLLLIGLSIAAAMLLMISLVGLCIFVFSIGYMDEDKNFSRFFAYLSFFSGAHWTYGNLVSRLR